MDKLLTIIPMSSSDTPHIDVAGLFDAMHESIDHAHVPS